MSGIVGVIFKDGRPVSNDELRRMLSTLSHRGPDASGVWREGNVGLGQCLLRTTPESLKDHQPLISRRGDLVLISDARIDNREDLISALDLHSSSEEITDSQLILSAYERWGESCPGKLLGDFVFAIWDKRDRKFFLARDYFGVKPLYYYDSGTLFVFASEIKALFVHSSVPRKINEQRLAFVLTRNPPPNNTITYFQDICRLPPAHTLVVSHQNLREVNYWSLDSTEETILGSDLEYAECFLEIFTESVQNRLRRVTPIGSMLSGGLDSSSITCLAGKVLKEKDGEPLHTFSATFPGAPAEDLRFIDEREYIDSVLSEGKYVAHFIRADRLSPLFDFDRLVDATDEPTMATNIYFHLAAFKLAHSLGIGSVLDGCDGDTVVSHGWQVLDEYRRGWKLGSLTRETLAISRLYSIPLRKAFSFYFLRPLLPVPVKKMRRRLWGEPDLDQDFSNGFSKFLNPAYVERVGLKDLLEDSLNSSSGAIESPKEIHRKNLTATMWPDSFEFLDKAAMSYSTEVRYPFWDRRLVEFCFGIPTEQKFRDGWSRVVLRRAMEGVLPKMVQWRLRKANLYSNLLIRLAEHEDSSLRAAGGEDSVLIEDFYEIKKLREAYSRYKVDPRQNSQECQALFAAVVLAKWIKSISRRWTPA